MTIIRVIDFETNGTGEDAQVIEAAVCDVINGNDIRGPISQLFGADHIPPEVRAIHHIQMADIAHLEQFDPEWLFCDVMPNMLAAHNAEFEQRFVTTHLPWICTYKAALRIWPDAPSHSNGALRYWLEDQGLIAPAHKWTQPAHRAGPDAYVTAHILTAILQTGVGIAELIEWTNEPRLLPRCPIGKFRGKPWHEVEEGFLGWMTRQADMAEDLKWNAQREINRRMFVGEM